jgi:hypothetical protein
VTITAAQRAGLIAGGVACGTTAALLPMIRPSDARPAQLLLACAAMITFLFVPFTRSGLPAALLMVAGSAALGLTGGDATAVALAGSGVLGLAAAELLSLAAVWRSAVPTTMADERPHLRGIAHKAVVGAVAAGGILLVSIVRLPSPTVALVVGLGAAAVAFWLVIRRVADDTET